MKRLALLLALLGGGCDERPLELFVIDPGLDAGAVEQTPAFVLDACDILAADCRIVGEQEVFDRQARGIVQIDWTDPQPGQRCGSTFVKMADGCVRGVRSCRSATSLAHELTHVLGFPSRSDHSDDPGNVLHQRARGTELTDHQFEVTGRHMRRLARCL